jgi:hypothetical protein
MMFRIWQSHIQYKKQRVCDRENMRREDIKKDREEERERLQEEN